MDQNLAAIIRRPTTLPTVAEQQACSNEKKRPSCDGLETVKKKKKSKDSGAVRAVVPLYNFTYHYYVCVDRDQKQLRCSLCSYKVANEQMHIPTMKRHLLLRHNLKFTNDHSCSPGCGSDAGNVCRIPKLLVDKPVAAFQSPLSHSIVNGDVPTVLHSTPVSDSSAASTSERPPLKLRLKLPSPVNGVPNASGNCELVKRPLTTVVQPLVRHQTVHSNAGDRRAMPMAALNFAAGFNWKKYASVASSRGSVICNLCRQSFLIHDPFPAGGCPIANHITTSHLNVLPRTQPVRRLVEIIFADILIPAAAAAGTELVQTTAFPNCHSCGSTTVTTAFAMPCGHRSCLNCHEKTFYDEFAQCAFCEKSYPRAAVLYASSHNGGVLKVPVCIQCPIPASTYCKECRDFLCPTCSRAHGFVKLTMDHRLTEVQEFSALECSTTSNNSLDKTASSTDAVAIQQSNGNLKVAASLWEQLQHSVNYVKNEHSRISRIQETYSEHTQSMFKMLDGLFNNLIGMINYERKNFETVLKNHINDDNKALSNQRRLCDLLLKMFNMSSLVFTTDDGAPQTTLTNDVMSDMLFVTNAVCMNINGHTRNHFANHADLGRDITELGKRFVLSIHQMLFKCING